MKTRISILFMFVIPMFGFAQTISGNFTKDEADELAQILQISKEEKTIILEDCYRWAEENYPLIRQYNLIEKSKEYTLSNIAKTYLPQVTLNGQATYQTDVTKLPIDFASLNLPIDIKKINKDQYKMTADVSQVIWDGGNTSALKDVANANADVQSQQNKVTIYQIKDRINQLYFGILGTDAQLMLLGLLQNDLETNKFVMISMYNNGMIMQSDLDAIDVQLINVEQNKIEQNAYKEAYIQMLSLFIHKELSIDNIFRKPTSIVSGLKTVRPELQLYSLQREMYDKQLKTIDAKNMPQVGAFIQGGYANPALNMLDNRFKLYAVGGIKVSWNLGNLYTKKNEKRKIQLDRESIDVQEDTFRFNINQQLTQESLQINKTKKLMEKDDKIIQLQERIKLSSESKYKNGVYPINDLIQDINAANQARQTKALREIQYLQQQYNYDFTQGN